MRHMTICQLSTDNDVKINAMQVLLLSIEHEEEASHLKAGSTSSDHNPFPSFITWINRIGGVTAMWTAVLDAARLSSSQHPNNHRGNNHPNHPNLRNLTCQFIEKLHTYLPYKKEDLTASFITAGGIPVLGQCLDVEASVESAAKALAAIVSKDATGMAFGSNMETQQSDEVLVLHILDLVMSRGTSIKLCLSIVLITIIERESTYVSSLLSTGIMPVYVSILRDEPSPALKGVALSLIAAVLNLVMNDAKFHGITINVIEGLMDVDVISALLDIVPCDDMMLTRRCLIILDLLSSNKATHDVMISDSNQITPTVTKVTEVLNQVAVMQGESDEDEAMFDFILSSCFRIFKVLSSTLLNKEEFLKNTNFIDSVLLVSASQNRLTSDLTHVDAINLLSIFAVYPFFAERLEAIDGHYIICDQVLIHYDAFVDTPFEISPLILITYILYHAVTMTLMPKDLLMLSERQLELRMWNDESLFDLMCSSDAIWNSLRRFLEASQTISSALRFLQIILQCPHDNVQNQILEQMNKFDIVPVLFNFVDMDKNFPNSIVDNALIALGTLSGLTPYYPWESSLAAQRLSLIRQEGRHPASFRGGGLNPREACILLAAQKRSEMKMDSRKRKMNPNDDALHLVDKVRKDLASLPYLKRICAPLLTKAGEKELKFMGACRVIKMCTDYAVENNLSKLIVDDTTQPPCNHEIFNFTSAIQHMEPISRVSAIQTFSILAKHLDVPVERPQKALFNSALAKSIHFVCEELSNNDPVVVINSLFAAHSLVRRYGQFIWNSGGPHFIKLLNFRHHIHDADLDSAFLVDTSLSILDKLTHSEQIAMQLTETEMAEKMVDLAVDGAIISEQQVVSEAARRSETGGDSIIIDDMALKCLSNLCRFISCREALFAATTLEPLMQCLTNCPSAFRLLNDEDFVDVPNLIKPPPDAEADDPTTYPRIELERGAKVLIDILYQLSSCPGSILYKAFCKNSTLISHFLLLSWRDYHATSIGRKCVALFMRLGCGLHERLPDSSPQIELMKDEDTFKSQPWSFFLESHQLILLFEIINFDITARDPDSPFKWELDHHCVVRSKRYAIAAFHSLLVPGTASFEACRFAVLDLCESSKFLHVLENHALRATEAALLLSEIFSWPDVNFRYTSRTYANTMIQILQQGSESNMSRCAVVRAFGSAIVHSPNSRSMLLGQLPRALIAKDLSNILNLCLQFLTLATGDDNVPEDVDTGPLKWPDTLVLGLVLVTALFEDGRGGLESQYSAEELHLQATLCRGLVSMVKGYVSKRKNCWDDSETLGDVPLSMWSSLLTCSSSPTCSSFLLHNCDVAEVLQLSFSLHAQEFCRNQGYIPSEDLNISIQILLNLIDIYPEDVATLVVKTHAVLPEVSTILLKMCANTTSSQEERESFVKPAVLSLFYSVSCSRKPEIWKEVGVIPEFMSFLLHHVMIALDQNLELERASHSGSIVFSEDQVRDRNVSVQSLAECVATLVNLCRHDNTRVVVLSFDGFIECVCKFLRDVPISAPDASGHVIPLVSVCLSLLHILIPNAYGSEFDFGKTVSEESEEKTVGASKTDDENTDTHSCGADLSLANLLIESLLRIATDVFDIKCMDTSLSILLMLESHKDFFMCYRTVPVIISFFRIFSRVVPLTVIPEEDSTAPTGPFTLLRTEVCDKSLQLIHSASRGDPAVFNEALNTQLHYRCHQDQKDCEDDHVKTESASLVASIVHILTSAPRSMTWFPVLLRTSDVLKTLIVNENLTAEIMHRMRSHGNRRPYGNLESHILLNALNVSNDIMQPHRIPSLNLQGLIKPFHHIAQSEWVDDECSSPTQRNHNEEKFTRSGMVGVIVEDEDGIIEDVFNIGSTESRSRINSESHSPVGNSDYKRSTTFENFIDDNIADETTHNTQVGHNTGFETIPKGLNFSENSSPSSLQPVVPQISQTTLSVTEDASELSQSSESVASLLSVDSENILDDVQMEEENDISLQATATPPIPNSDSSSSINQYSNDTPPKPTPPPPPPPPTESSVVEGRTLHEQRVAEMRAKAREIMRLKNLEREQGNSSTVISKQDD